MTTRLACSRTTSTPRSPRARSRASSWARGSGKAETVGGMEDASRRVPAIVLSLDRRRSDPHHIEGGGPVAPGARRVGARRADRQHAVHLARALLVIVPAEQQ